MKGILKDVKDHQGFGRPAKALTLGEKTSCTGCNKEIEENDFVYLSWKTAGLYCKNCDYPSFNNNSGFGHRRVATHVRILYDLPEEKEKVKQDLIDDYETNGLELPEGDQLETLVEKRMNNRDSGRDDFLEKAKPLTEIVG